MAKGKVAKRPTRDEFVLEELGNQLVEAKREDSDIILTVWGWEEPCEVKLWRWIHEPVKYISCIWEFLRRFHLWILCKSIILEINFEPHECSLFLGRILLNVSQH